MTNEASVRVDWFVKHMSKFGVLCLFYINMTAYEKFAVLISGFYLAVAA